MSDELILSFPVLKKDSGDFLDSIIYITKAINDRKLTITHTLKGQSFIAELIKDKKAKFAVALYYKDNAERQNFVCDKWDYDENTEEISTEQNIDIDFSYAPEITPYIVVMNDNKIVVNDKSGLTDFWQGEEFSIPSFSRIAHHSKLKFTSGNVSSLLNVQCETEYKSGSIKTNVNEMAGEGEQPIKIYCAQDVYDELKKGVSDNPTDVRAAMRTAIVTQVLCHVYAHMDNSKETDIHSGLLQHLEEVKEKTKEDWEGDEFNASFAATQMDDQHQHCQSADEFNASFAATQMIPYAIEALNKENR